MGNWNELQILLACLTLHLLCILVPFVISKAVTGSGCLCVVLLLEFSHISMLALVLVVWRAYPGQQRGYLARFDAKCYG